MEPLKHECGVAMIRLLKPLSYYTEKYGTDQWALAKLYLLMEKQHNRGQEGAGIACVKLDVEPGTEYMFRERAEGTTAITEIFNRPLPKGANIFMGHLRYSTTGRSGLDFIHPFLRRNNWRAKNLALCGNFNMTNVDEVFSSIVANGQHPRKYADTHILLEQLGHRLDREVERVYQQCEKDGLTGLTLTHAIEDCMDIARVLRTSSPLWDGGYVMCGLTGSGETFALRDPWGIRTAFWYADEEVIVLASERPVIQTVLNVPADAIQELQPGQALLTSKSGQFRLEQINAPITALPDGTHVLGDDTSKPFACSFERIYFSRGSDRDIYRERKELGRRVVDQILPAIDNDIEHTVFSFIPNTAEVAFYGLVEGVSQHSDGRWVRIEKVAIKDIKLRTFIAEGNSRNDLAAHVYDITYGSLEPHVDNLVVIDDSIVRGTTLRQSIIRILDRLQPRKIIIVSSAPQIRYPDYYGIDMSSMDQFIAFRAAIELLHERGMQDVITSVYYKAKTAPEGVNYVKEIYAPFSDEEISQKIAQLLTPADITTPVEIIFQRLEGLRQSCPNHRGDWYFSGNYPTRGGLKLLNKAYIEWYEETLNQHSL